MHRLALSALSVVLLAETARVQETPGRAGRGVEQHTLANSSVSRTVSWAGGRLATVSIKNRLTGAAYALAGDEFSIEIDGMQRPVTARAARVTGTAVEKLADGERLVATLSAPGLAGAGLRVAYELKAADFFGRKWVEIDPPAGGKIPVASVTVESLSFRGRVNCTCQGIGQPVYLDDLFVGLEWPRAANGFRRGTVTCTHWPAWDVGGPFRSKSAVWGAAPEGEVSHCFVERYVPTIRISRPEPILVYNSWYDVRGPRMDKYEETIAGFHDRLVGRHGVTLESFVVDDGWQDKKSIYGTRFPAGFDRLRRKIETDLPGCRLGLWMPIGGGGSGLDRDWGRENGYEVVASEKPYAYCLLGRRYGEALAPRLEDLITDLGVNYFKHDFNSFACREAGHGHRTGGGASTESQVEGMFRWMHFMKKLNPTVYLNYTSGMNLSPWWLMGCDCVWFGGSDWGFFGNGPPRERAICYRDRIMREGFVRRGYQFPPNAIMTHGIIKGRHMYGWKDRPIEEWQRYVLMYFGRGVMMWELYLTPSLLTDEEWAFLAKTVKWARANAGVLAHSTRFILGDVADSEPYGYAHCKNDRCILFLRNPGGRLGKDAAELTDGWKVLRSEDKADIPEGFVRPEFDDAGWEGADIPRREGGAMPYEEEHLAYRRRFHAPAAWEGRPVRVFFQGVDDNCEVFVNGTRAGAHKGWSSFFDFEVSGSLHYGGENVLAVLVWNDPRGRGGIYKPVTVGAAEVEGDQEVSFTLDPKACGFDPKYARAEVTWIYPEGRRAPRRLGVGQRWDFSMKTFDVFVLDLKLRE